MTDCARMGGGGVGREENAKRFNFGVGRVSMLRLQAQSVATDEEDNSGN